MASPRDGARATLDSPGVLRCPRPAGNTARNTKGAAMKTKATRTTTCPGCQGSGTEWYQARDGEYVQAACSQCGNGQVNSKGSGTVPG